MTRAKSLRPTSFNATVPDPNASAASTEPVIPESTADERDPIVYRIGARELAEFVHRRGDIHLQFDDRTRAEEGIRAQQDYQSGIVDPGYRREVRIERTFHQGMNDVCASSSEPSAKPSCGPPQKKDASLSVEGRIDGCSTSPLFIEEIKTTRGDPAKVFAHSRQHMAQAKLYAAMLAAEYPCESCRVQVTYLHPDHPALVTNQSVFSATLSAREVEAFWAQTCAAYLDWLAEVNARLERRNASLKRLAFPYPDFREEQRRLARHVYVTLRDSNHLLGAAPTGTGKTIATIFPAAKALGEGVLDRFVFATSRTTGQAAAEGALGDIVNACVGASGSSRGSFSGSLSGAETSPSLSSVTITAKERICFNPELPCDPEVCTYARGYYDRVRGAVSHVLAAGVADRDTMKAVAREHRLCPFELSLDAAEWADVVVCDYNYVLDPIVSLKRLTTRHFSQVGLLVDEAHQLGDRTRDILSATIDRRALKSAMEEQATRHLRKRIQSIDRALMAYARRHLETDGELAVDETPSAVYRAMERFVSELFESDVDLRDDVATNELSFLVHRFLTGRDWYTADAFTFTLKRDRREVVLAMRCLLPGAHIRETLDTYHGAVRFSGTLAPAHIFQSIHGCDGATVTTRPPFSNNQLGIFVVDDVATYYRHRTDTAPMAADLILDAWASSPQNVLVAFPSFEYLNIVADAISKRLIQTCRGEHDEGAFELVRQTPAMPLEAREAFIARVNDSSHARVPCLAFVVMGGIFTESVDYDGKALSSIVVIGAGLPPISIERDEISRAGGAEGFEMAYRQPAMTRAVQSAGRVVRSLDDFGSVVLVDPRFTQTAFRAYFPSHWQPRRIRSADVGRHLRAFWEEAQISRAFSEARD